MASLYKRGEIWWGRVQRQGQELRRSLETRSKSVAKSRLEQWLQELNASAWGDKPRVTINEAADRFIREHGPTLRPKSLVRYTVSLEWLTQHFGTHSLDKVGSAELRGFETWRRSMGASAPTVRRDLAALSSVYGFMIEAEVVDQNPVSPFLKARKKRGLRESPPRTRYLSGEEEAALLAECEPTVRAAVRFAIYTGLRQREQFQLTWDRVKLDASEIRIPKEQAKSRKERTVVMLPPAVEVCRHIPRHIRSAFVFHHDDGRPFVHLNKGMLSAARRAGISDVRWHDLRRTHGCRLLQEWEWSIEMVRDQLGHSNTEITQKVYAFLEVKHRHGRVQARTTVGT